MSKNLDIQAKPFFARFLVEQQPPQPPTDTPPSPPPIWTFKWPSDWEEI
ncbi:microviridin/marinostatin family tricyclic proteinase inhibitor [Desmonostoc muscorum LEGE 12446]|nr:microviridin/marinostatin family tricyclic proteinase inhibitor [Desmonostoc muscorum]MCF2148702.1 microviridin/marinostatin family tricyclic proteinase inhibitor [Desmonostoc muscorum LEGE 12446]